MLKGRGKKLVGPKTQRQILKAAVQRAQGLKDPVRKAAAMARVRQQVAEARSTPAGPPRANIAQGIAEPIRGANPRRPYTPNW